MARAGNLGNGSGWVTMLEAATAVCRTLSVSSGDKRSTHRFLSCLLKVLLEECNELSVRSRETAVA